MLATAKPHVFATQITARLGLDGHLLAQFGPELDGTRNDKAELLAHAMRQLDQVCRAEARAGVDSEQRLDKPALCWTQRLLRLWNGSGVSSRAGKSGASV